MSQSNTKQVYSNLTGRTAIISGASRGIGEATARLFASAGANVVLCARSVADINRIAKEINSIEHQGSALAVSCDVADYQAVKAVIEKSVNEFGKIDILINNAGVIQPIARFEDSDPAAWSAAFDINLKGVYNTMHASFNELKRNEGVIVNISSGAATSALEGWSHYCSSKAAAFSLTKCAHEEWAALGIRTVGLSPGTVATQMQIDIKKSAMNIVSTLDWESHVSTETVAQAIAWLTTDAAKKHDGTDVSLRNVEIRDSIGLDV